MSSKKLVVIINASPKVKTNPSVSGYLSGLQESYMEASGIDIHHINVRESLSSKDTDKNFEIMRKADAIIFNFPLYIFCLPGMLMRFLQDYVTYRKDGPAAGTTAEASAVFSGKSVQKIYAVVNCGFPEAYINEEAVNVIKSFSRKIGAMFRFGVLLGSGGMIIGNLDYPVMKTMKAGLEEAFQTLADDILKEGQDSIENKSYEANFPRRLYLFMGNRFWYSEAKKNGLKKKALYQRPYLK